MVIKFKKLGFGKTGTETKEKEGAYQVEAVHRFLQCKGLSIQNKTALNWMELATTDVGLDDD